MAACHSPQVAGWQELDRNARATVRARTGLAAISAINATAAAMTWRARSRSDLVGEARAASTGGAAAARSDPQCLHRIADSWISSAQNGHGFIGTSRVVDLTGPRRCMYPRRAPLA